MSRWKSRLVLTAALVTVAAAGTTGAFVPAFAVSAGDLRVADANGPSTGGGDTPYLSNQQAKPDQSSPAAQPQPSAQEAVPSVGSNQSPAATPPGATTPSATAPSEALGKPEPVNPPEKSVTSTTPVPTAPTASKPSQQVAQPTQPAASPVPEAVPATPVPAAVPAAPADAPKPATEAATPVSPATVAPSHAQVATTPKSQASTTPPDQTKPKQKLAKKKAKPVHEPDVAARDVPPPYVRRVPDDSDMIYDDGPLPPRPIGHPRHVIIESDNDDGGDYVVVRRYHRVCQRPLIPGFWFLHRDVICD